jgi:aminoethylphosphonate catabolism LysR family transcriptional regulator
MNFAQLKAFHAVASAGSFTGAAALLGVSQPAVTMQVKALEEAHGVSLIDRRGRRLELTELGTALMDVTRRLFSQEEEARELLDAARELRRGHLRVGADAPIHVIALLAAFRQRYPGVHVSLAIGNSDEVLHGLLELRSDLAVLAEVPDDPRFHAIPAVRHRLVAFVPKRHPWARRKGIRLADLDRQPMVLREPGSITRRTFEAAAAAAAVSPQVAMQIESREAVREAVAAGLGVGVVSAAEFGHDARLRALPITDAVLENTEYLVCLRERRKLRLVRAVLEVAAETMPQRRETAAIPA